MFYGLVDINHGIWKIGQQKKKKKSKKNHFEKIGWDVAMF